MIDYAESEARALQEEAHDEWIEEARKKAIEISRRRGEVSADDIAVECPPPVGTDPRVIGAVWFPRKEWEIITYRKSARHAVNHGRRIAVWRWVGGD